MATVMQEYRNIVRGFRPAATVKVVFDYPRTGDRSYQIVDGVTPVGDPQIDPTTAWREADALLSRGPCLATVS
jgi:hypothetical protein